MTLTLFNNAHIFHDEMTFYGNIGKSYYGQYFCGMENLKKTIFLLFACMGLMGGYAQTEEENEVMKPINLLFDGMLKADTAIIKKAFAKNVIMKVVSDKGTKDENLKDFLNQIANKKVGSDAWIEKLYNTEIRIDGSLAHVWTEYSFFVGEKFNHCGVDSFALIKSDGVWKIVYILDTRRRENCNKE